jgi:2-polyprenyl-3-methyl-5-hydroxy-6-metoxy-1,4-benzoquinol methylase
MTNRYEGWYPTTPTLQIMESLDHDTVDIAWITDDCERVSHLQQDDLYFAHLSIYWFALQFCTGKTVLDAGSGTGYGSAYLAENGAHEVHAIDVSDKAVEYSKVTFRRPNLGYQTMDLQEITGFPNHHFDVIFSSNVFEHIPDVSVLMRRAWELLRSDGVMIVAVPPITNRASRRDNVMNPYHLKHMVPATVV